MRSLAKASMSEQPPSSGKCPLCGKPREQRFRPFCSKRCADIDLARWFKGDYALPSREGPELDEDERPVDDDGQDRPH